MRERELQIYYLLTTAVLEQWFFCLKDSKTNTVESWKSCLAASHKRLKRDGYSSWGWEITANTEHTNEINLYKC